MTHRSRLSALIAAAVVVTSATLASAAALPATSNILPGVSAQQIAECTLTVPQRSPLGY